MKQGIANLEFRSEMPSYAWPAFPQEFQLLRSIARSTHRVLARENESQDDRAYYARLDLRIRQQLRDGSTSFSALSRSCEGAWPGLISQRLTDLGLWNSVAATPSAIPVPSYAPELHCGFGEWYFSPDSARELTQEFISKKSFSLLLGTPTLAQLARNSGSDFALVDSNPFVGLRFPELRDRIHYSSVEQLRETFQSPSTIFFDAPWYMPKILSWLAKASLLADKRSTIAMPLFRAMTRPAAMEERELILSVAESIGRTEVIPDCIAYDTPLYESEALASRSIFAHANWRRADLLIIRNPTPVQPPQAEEADVQDIWENFLIGTQVVRLRLHPIPRKRRALLQPIPGTREYVLDTVSARDGRRKRIDIWTSRNRVAMVGDVRRARYALSMLQNSNQNTGKILRSWIPISEADDLAELLAITTFH